MIKKIYDLNDWKNTFSDMGVPKNTFPIVEVCGIIELTIGEKEGTKKGEIIGSFNAW